VRNRSPDFCLTPLLGRQAHGVFFPVSQGYPPPTGRFSTCSSPVRHGRPPKGFPSDLHALGTPPALFLSQDQTLHQSAPCRCISCLVQIDLHAISRAGPLGHASVVKVQGVGSCQWWQFNRSAPPNATESIAPQCPLVKGDCARRSRHRLIPGSGATRSRLL
jgi:hypothetical protein